MSTYIYVMKSLVKWVMNVPICYNHYKKVTDVMVFGDEMLAIVVYLFPNIALLYIQPFQIKGCSEMPCDDMKELASSSVRLPTDRPSSFNILY
jgi:hypothetical protein